MQNIEADTVSSSEEHWVHVVAGVIFNSSGDEVLLARRPVNKHQGGKWEFPGGKVESVESAKAALIRELDEELGIQVYAEEISSLIEIRHRYTDKSIFLDVWKISAFSGKPYGREGQEVKWFGLKQLVDLDFPAANASIIEHLLK